MVYAAYVVMILFITLYLITQYLFENTQYGIAAIIHLVTTESTLSQVVFNSTATFINRRIYDIQSFKTIYIGLIFCATIISIISLKL